MKLEVFAVAVAVAVACLLPFSTSSAAQPTPAHLYVSWQGAEPDKGASAWFIKLFVDAEAAFDLREPGSSVEGGVAFDVPQARYRRTRNESTLETLLRVYPVADPAVRRLANITHDIEINLWRPKVFPESAILEHQVKEIGLRFDGAIPMSCFLPLFDEIHRLLTAGSADLAPMNIPAACSGPPIEMGMGK